MISREFPDPKPHLVKKVVSDIRHCPGNPNMSWGNIHLVKCIAKLTYKIQKHHQKPPGCTY